MSGSTIGSVVGGTIGFFIGGPAGVRWGLTIGGALGGAVAPGTIKGPSIGDAQQQTSQAGAPRPVVFGHPAPFAGNLIDGEKVARKRTKKTKQGKGGPTVKTEQFLLTSAIRVCEGPIAGYIRIWEDGVCVYDARTSFPPGWEGYSSEVRTRQAKWLANAALYLGTEDQLPDPELEAIHGVGNTPYYRGTAYIRVKDADRTATKGTAARYMFEVAAAGVGADYTDYVTDLGPEFYYKLQGDTVDAMGNYADLVPGGSYSYGGEGIVFGSGGGAGVLQASGVDGVSSWTIFLKASPSTNAAGIQRLAGHITNELGGTYNWQFWLQGMRLYSGLSSGGTILAGPLIEPDDLIVCAMRKSGSNLTLWFGGSEADADTTGSGAFSGSAAFVIGGGDFVGSEGHLVGFKRALTDAEMRKVSIALGVNVPSVVVVPDAEGSIWDLLRRELETAAMQYSTFEADEGVALADVEAEIMDRCGVPTAHYDLSALDEILIPGFLVTEQPTGAETLQPLMQSNFHDLPEVDDQIVARVRGGAVVASFSDDDLIETGEDGENETRPQQMEFPARVSVVTQDPDADYAAIPQVSYRFSPSIDATSEVVLQVPIPYSADDAARIAHKAHKVLWSNAEAVVERVLPEEYSRLVVSDPVEYDDRRWIVEDRQYFDGEVKLRLKYERASDYESGVTGQAVDPPTPPDSSVLGPTVLFAANLPSLRAEDNVPGIYVFACGVVPGYPGCDVYLSIDGGLTEQLVLSIPASQASVMGELVEDEPSGGEPLTVRLYNAADILENVSAAQVLQGANAAMLLDENGEAEIIGFEDAAENTSEDWEISTITRGGLATTEIPRVTGDRFSLLESAYFLPIDPTLAGQTLILRGVTVGTVVDANPTFSLVYEPGDIIIDGGGDPL